MKEILEALAVFSLNCRSLEHFSFIASTTVASPSPLSILSEGSDGRRYTSPTDASV